MLFAAAATDTGPTRPANEDCFAIDQSLGLLVIADGMGGHNAGEVASRMVVDGVVDHLKRAGQSPSGTNSPRPSLYPFGHDPLGSITGNLLRNAILIAGLQILETAVTSEDYAGMGTTVVVAQVVGECLTVAHVGDSRLYRLAAGRLQLLTSDDSWMATMLSRDPAIDPDAYRHHPMRHALTNVVGGRARADVHLVEERLRDGDRLLLTTDGVHGVLDDTALERLVGADDQLGAIADRVVRTALARGARDNCTAIVAQYRRRQTET